MKKFFILLIFCLTLTLSLLLKWQWHAFSTGSSDTEEANQKIQIVSSSSKLDIKQTFTGLNSKMEYQVLVPKQISDWSCETKTGKQCESNDQNPNTFQTEDGVLKIKYSIPIERSTSYLLLSDWKMKLNKVSIRHSTLTIAESFLRKGIWISGLPIKGYQQLDLIDFFSFEGEGDFESLFFQDKRFHFHGQELSYSYYFNDQSGDKLVLPHFKQLPNRKFIAIVSSNAVTYVNKDMIMVKESQKNTDIDNLLVRQYFKQKLEPDSDWLLNVFTSYSSKSLPSNSKTKEILNELKSELSDSELEEFYQKVISSPLIHDGKDLDAILSEAKGLETKFFQSNLRSTSQSPLYFIDHKLVTLNGENVEKLEFIYMNSKRLYPVDKLLSLMGFKVNHTENQLYIKKKSLSYQFDLNQNFFQLNGHEYGLLENPFININHHYYIDENMLKALFNIELQIEGEKIIIIEERK